jgi:hypothetical protein
MKISDDAVIAAHDVIQEHVGWRGRSDDVCERARQILAAALPHLRAQWEREAADLPLCQKLERERDEDRARAEAAAVTRDALAGQVDALAGQLADRPKMTALQVEARRLRSALEQRDGELEEATERERIFREFVVYLVHMCEEDGYDCTCRPCVRLRRAKQEFDAHLGPGADEQPEKLTPPGETGDA